MTAPSIEFRQQALQHMVESDADDTPPFIINPLDWLLFTTVLILTLFAIIFAVLVQAPVTVSGRGMLLQPEGVATVIAEHGGLIEQVLVEPGQKLEEGDIVALLAQPERRSALREAEAVLADAVALENDTRTLMNAEVEKERELVAQRERSQAQRRQAANARLTELLRRQAYTQSMLNRGLATRVALREIDNDVAMGRSLLAEIDAEASRDRQDWQSSANRRQARALELRLAIDQAERRVEQARRRLAESRELRSRTSGVVTEIQADQGVVVQVGAPVAGLLPEAASNAMQALVYVPAGPGKSIDAEMAVAVAPEALRRDVYGHIKAQVTRVAPLPATAEGIIQRFGNPELARELLAQGLALEIEAGLTLDAATPSGFAWSTLTGSDRPIDAGTIVQADIIVRERPLLSFLLPSLEDRFKSWRKAFMSAVSI